MKKKWLCLFVWVLLMLLPLTGLNRLEAKLLLARALTATGGACGDDALMALGSAALGGAGGGSLDELDAALDASGFARGLAVSPRALAAAERLIAGERTLDASLTRFSTQPPDGPHVRVGAFYFH